ncbi:MAG: type II toxin-antitoxin system VapC family toxin [Candidatus Korarchaeum sp.]
MKVFIDATVLIYLNVGISGRIGDLKQFWKSLVENHKLYTNLIVLDEVIYVLKRKYAVEPSTLKFIDKMVLPQVIDVGLREYLEARKYILEYGMKPSDAIHLATIESNRIDAIATEDKDFDVVGIESCGSDSWSVSQ